MFKQPPYLKKNEKVALIATAKNFEKKELKSAISILKDWGLEVVEAKYIYSKHNQFAGTDEQRTSDLQWALDNPEIKAIFCVRGGYGTARIIDEIDFAKFKKNPKWVVGFSDVTVLHAAIQKNNIQSIHAVMPIQFGKSEYQTSVLQLKKVLFGKQVSYSIPAYAHNRMGNAKGNLVGGNLSIICSIIGTKTALKTNNTILFIEDVGENIYRIDRMMVQLKRAGLLENLAGLIVGHFTNMEDNAVKFGKSAYGIISEAVSDYDYPVCFQFPAGHEAENMPLKLGGRITMDITRKKVTLKI